MAFDWTPRNTEHLRDMWAKGLPASKIGAAIGCSRNAAIAKARRLGLDGRPSPIKRSPDGISRKRQRIEKTPEQRRAIWTANAAKASRRAAELRAQPNLPLVVIPKPRAVPIVTPGAVPFKDLKSGQCRWIPGAIVPGRADEALACGERVASIACPYCEDHRAKAADKRKTEESREAA